MYYDLLFIENPAFKMNGTRFTLLRNMILGVSIKDSLK